MNAETLNLRPIDKNREIEKQIKDATYVICSTLNQMVNYIPYRIFGFEHNIYNITIKNTNEKGKQTDGKYFNNELWDNNFKNILPKNITVVDKIILEQNETSKINYIVNCLENKIVEGKTYFWNITGGQRALVLAIIKFIREKKRRNDFICYLEGNNNQLVVIKNNEQVYTNRDYYIDNFFTIETALKLAGFQNNRIFTAIKNNTPIEDEYFELVNKYIEDCKSENHGMREFLLAANKGKIDDKSIYHKDFLKKEIDSLKKQGKTAFFGYILEKMAYAIINENFKNELAHFAFSYHINFASDRKIDYHDIDEFDIVLLTKHGKLIIFECKSGIMEGDVAKSHKYSTYAVAGVYGKPILITPLLKDEIPHINNDNNKFNKLDKEIYKNVKKAIRAAQRASLETWGIDEIKSKLKKLLK